MARSQRRIEAAIEPLDDGAVRRATTLAGWTVAHVLAHLARNADSHRRRAEGAARGESVDQYPGGYAGRARAIETDAARSAFQLVRDVAVTGELLATTWASLPSPAWRVVSRDVSGTERPLTELPGRRWQELEVHLVDLGVGVTHRDWTDDFVGVWLPRLRSMLFSRLPPDASGPEPGAIDERDELAWLYGRFLPPGLPALPRGVDPRASGAASRAEWARAFHAGDHPVELAEVAVGEAAGGVGVEQAEAVPEGEVQPPGHRGSADSQPEGHTGGG